MNRLLILGTLSLVGSMSLGCGAAPPTEPTITPFLPEHARLFEDGIDFVANPEDLEGRWRDDWEEELDQRVGACDVIALVTVHTLRADVEPNRRTTRRIVTNVERILFGEMSGSERTLRVAETAVGYSSVAGNERRILNQPFIAFIKWVRDPDGSIQAHFHLSPGAEAVIDRVIELVHLRSGTRPEDRRTIVVHRGAAESD